jgi:hypothetical protein
MNEKVSVRKRFSPAERSRLLNDYRASGLTQREFAAQAGISLACLSIWLRRERDAGPAPVGQVSFVEIPSAPPRDSFPTPLGSASAESFCYKAHFPGGISIDVPRGFCLSEARDLFNLARSV